MYLYKNKLKMKKMKPNLNTLGKIIFALVKWIIRIIRKQKERKEQKK